MKFIITLLSVLITNILFACDFCGAFMGITPYDNQSCITLMYRYKSFNGYHYSQQPNNIFPQRYEAQETKTTNTNHQYKHLIDSEHPKYAESDYELYTTAELRAKYFIHRRIELNIIIPFIMNQYQVGDEKQKITGCGDITFLGAYHIISNVTTRIQQRLIAGGGIKLSTGSDCLQNEEGERIDFMMQPGTGSTDYTFYINYICSYKAIGVNINSTYKFNGENNHYEYISNSTTNALNLFYKFREEKDLKLFPSLQAYYEYSKGEYIKNAYQPATKMDVLTAGIGLDIFYKNFSLSTQFQLPVYENKITNTIAMSGKLMVALTYNFNQKNYLIKSKNKS